MLALHRAPAFPDESMDALAELAGHVQQVSLEEGDVLWNAGARAEGFWVVCSGAVELTWAPATRLTVGPGGVPGLVETLADRDFACEARAIERTTLLSVAIDPFMDLIEDHFELASSLLGWLARPLIG
jgi:CRP-like cAMP-binding protein